VAVAANATPALIIQDLLLGDMDAFELLRRLRALSNGAQLPIVALSGSEGALEEARTRPAGFTALVVKPVAPSRLVEIVRACLSSDAIRHVPITTDMPAPRTVEPDGEPDARADALAQQCRVQAAQLALLSGVIGALIRHADVDDVLPNVLVAAFEEAAIAKGALLCRDLGGRWTVRHQAGFSAVEDLSGFFGHLALLDMVVSGGVGISIPSALVDDQVSADILAGANLAAAHLEPLASPRAAGVLVLGTTATHGSDRQSTFLAPIGPRVRQVLGRALSVGGDSRSSGRIHAGYS
jgi:CheY-like chemotaxis protein